MFILKLILCFFFPPIAVALHVGITKHFWINLLLTILLLGLPGVIHALWLVLTQKN
jgi:uncharacterized membrane protein YqaE (UPF0057 family)